jgi:ubiquinol-cytochrome c reductase iron-sulfur subunit
VSRARDTIVAALLLLVGRRRRPSPLLPGERERIVPEGEPRPGAELVVLALLFLAGLFAIGFPIIYAFEPALGSETQLLGASLGLALLFLAAALIVTSKTLVVTEEKEEEYPENEHPHEQELVAGTVADSGSRITRRGLFKLGLGAAGGGLGLAAITPLVSLGPVFHVAPFYGTPWKRGRRIVDEKGKPYKADDIARDDFYLGFAEGADKEELGASIVMVRLAPDQFDLPPQLRDYPADGIVAYSRICTHAGCAISLYRAPLFQPDEPKPALVCPCHYSTFDPGRGGQVTFGPAGRDLPMLPLSIDRKGYLRARHNFDEPVGPSWWGVRMRPPNP